MPSSLIVDAISWLKSPNCFLPFCPIARSSHGQRDKESRVGLCYSALLYRLLTSAPGTIRRFMGKPCTSVFGEFLERYLVELTVRVFIRHGLSCALGWWRFWGLCNRILLQECGQTR